jgi:hypothetical protein
MHLSQPDMCSVVTFLQQAECPILGTFTNTSTLNILMKTQNNYNGSSISFKNNLFPNINLATNENF